jgi:DNA-binding transcriptional LysR family regulator
VRIDLEEHVSDEVARHVVEHLCDVGVLASGTATDLELCAFPYRSDELAVVAPRDHRLAGASATTFADILGEDIIGLRHGSDLHFRLTRAAALAKKPLRLVVRVASFDAVCAMVAAGLGLGIAPARAAAPLLETLGLVAVPLTDAWARRDFCVCVREGGAPSGAAGALLDHLRAVVDGDGGIANDRWSPRTRQP